MIGFSMKSIAVGGRFSSCSRLSHRAPTHPLTLHVPNDECGAFFISCYRVFFSDRLRALHSQRGAAERMNAGRVCRRQTSVSYHRYTVKGGGRAACRDARATRFFLDRALHILTTAQTRQSVCEPARETCVAASTSAARASMFPSQASEPEPQLSLTHAQSVTLLHVALACTPALRRPERHLPLAGVLFVRPRAASEVHHLLGVEVTLRGELELRPSS